MTPKLIAILALGVHLIGWREARAPGEPGHDIALLQDVLHRRRVVAARRRLDPVLGIATRHGQRPTRRNAGRRPIIQASPGGPSRRFADSFQSNARRPTLVFRTRGYGRRHAAVRFLTRTTAK